jgi:hypothetical protein
VQLYLLVARTNKVVNNVGGRRVAASAAEPLAACEASDDTGRVMNATVAEDIVCQCAAFWKDKSANQALQTYAQACGGSSFSSSG